MTIVFHARPYGRFKEIKSSLRRKKLHRTNQGSNFLGGSLSNRDNVGAPIQFRISCAELKCTVLFRGDVVQQVL